jgi:single-strand DNA-binding protein
MNLNKAIIAGNLTRDPDKRALPNGTAITQFSVATNRSYTDKDGNSQQQVEYHNVVAFGKLAETCATYLAKGQQVLVEGRLQTRGWETNDGEKRQRTEIIAEGVQFGAKPLKPNREKEDDERPQDADVKPEPNYPSPESEGINPEDIPF